jgi:hypothetical protein
MEDIYGLLVVILGFVVFALLAEYLTRERKKEEE